MSVKLIAMGALALTFGATSYYAGNQYLENQTQARLSEFEKNLPKVEQKTVELTTVVVADARFGFGDPLKMENLKVVEWPAAQVLEGSFKNLEELEADVPRRALASIAAGEPILKQKVTGENARAGLAGIIAPGKRAVTISVNEVSGVAGFVQPGDRVDIVLTANKSRKGRAKSGIIMQNVKVLSIDQQTGERLEKAKIARSVTLEMDTKGAQKITYARSIGAMSLLLRGQGDEEQALVRADFEDTFGASTGKTSVPPKQDQYVDGNIVKDDDTSPPSPVVEAPQAPQEDSQSNFLVLNDDEQIKSKTIRVTNRHAVKSVTVPIEQQPDQQQTVQQ